VLTPHNSAQNACSARTCERAFATWVETAFEDVGISYQRSELKKSQLYLEALPLFMRGAVSIPDFQPLLHELRLLERSTHRSGKDTVDHGRNGSDDYANALCGCAVHAVKSEYDTSMAWVSGGDQVSRRTGTASGGQ
jgi:hypothetical protein